MVLSVACSRAALLESPAAIGQHLRALTSASAALPLSSIPRTRNADERQANFGWLPGAAAAGAVALVGAVAAVASGSISVKGDAPSPSSPPSAAATGEADEQTAVLARLRDWLTSQGADLSKVDIKPSQVDPGAGYGVFSTVAASAPRPGTPWWAWLWPWPHRGGPGGRGRCGHEPEPTTLASFPLDAAITARTACTDPQIGAQFSWMLDKHLLDERTAVMVYLLIERLRGDKSRFAPWIQALPTTFDVPIAYSEREMAALSGTALHRAAAAVSRRMRETWSRLEAPLSTVARELGLPAPRWEDWVWAHCVFWSRGQSLPVPESGAASNALVGHSSNGSDKIPIQILEGLVPGLDFCNHRLQPAPQCWWEVVAPERPKAAAETGSPAASTSSSSPSTPSASPAGSPAGPAVRLQLHSGARVRPGEELFISYGDKSNEELLMLYGFALEDNPHDHLMLYCPLPPKSEWDDVMSARMELLQAYGLRPQFFLPHPDQLEAAAAAAAAKPCKGRRKGSKAAAASAATAAPAAASQATPGGAGSRGSAGTADPAADVEAEAAPAGPLLLPGDVLDTLEVFVLNFQELAVRSKALQAKMEERRAARAAGTPLEAMSQHSPVLDLAALRNRYERLSPAELRHYLHALGLRMATLTAFIRLLEIKVTELEGIDGTGSLEHDERLLASLNEGQTQDKPPAEAAQSAGAAQQERRLRAALVYRIGQKRLARTWLVRAKGELRNLLALMRDMQARQEALERGQRQPQ